jgi:predicted metalloprotease with PDZ domain
VGPDWTLDEFNVGGKTYRVVVHSRGDEGDLRPNLVRDLEKIVSAEVRMWGPPDFEIYTFVLHFAGDTNSHDGMEHLTSAQIIRPGGLGDPGNYARTLEDAAHEFFHAWNVKRLRPAELGPWDWTRPANTEGLWIAEGLTQYYGAMMLRRAGLWSDSELLNDIEATIGDVENAQGNKLMSAVDASLAAPFIDGATHRQRTNLDNTSVSYYTKGELIGVVLDLSIRARTNGRRSLDDVLKQMYDECYLKAPNASYYLQGRGYTQADFVRILSEVAETDMSRFYDRYIRGVETLPYDEAFAGVGLRLVKTPAENASTGLGLDNADRQNLRLGSLRPGSPAERAGLQEGDILVSIGGASVTRGNWRSTLDRYKPGDRVTVQVRRFRETLDRVIELSAPAVFNYRLEEIANASAEARGLRAGWLSSS